MIKILFAFFIVFNSVYAACSKINMPTDYSIIANGTRANLKANFDEVQTKTNPCMDSVDEVRGRFSGYTGSLLMSSLEHLRLRLDSDASTTGRFLVESGNGDSLFRVSEDSSAKVFGALSVAGTSTFTGAPTFSSIATGRIPYTTTAGLLTSGTGLTYNGSAFSVTGTGDFSGAVTMSSTLAVNNTLSLPYTSALATIGNGTGSSAILVASAAGSVADIQWNKGTVAGTGARWLLRSNGTAESGSNAGSDWQLNARTDSGVSIDNPITVTRASGGAIALSRPVTMSSTLGVTGATTLTGNTTISGFIGHGGTAPSTNILYNIQGAPALTSINQFGLASQATFNSSATLTGNAMYAQLATENSAYTMATGRGIFIDATNKGAASTITTVAALDIASQTAGGTNYAIRTGSSGLIQLGSLTASSAVETDASKNLISVTKTGSGNDVYSASPTLTGTIAAANQTLSGTLGVTGVTTATGGLTLGASFVDKTTSLTSNTTLTTAHSTIFASASGGSFTLTLPAAAGNTGLTYTIYKTDVSAAATGGGNTVTIDGNASETIGGDLTQLLASNTGNGTLKIICDGSNWRIQELYDEGSFILTLTGCTTSPTATCYYTRINKSVSMLINYVSGTSNSSSAKLTGIPTSLIPARQSMVAIDGVVDNGLYYPGGIYIETQMTLYFKTSISSSLISTFTSSGTKGLLDRYSVSYNMQ